MEKPLQRLGDAAEALICLFMVCLVGLAFAQVVLRYVFNRSFFWAEEVILFAFTWLIFVASAVNLERGAHFGVDVLVNLLPRLGRRAVNAVAHAAHFSPAISRPATLLVRAVMVQSPRLF